MSISSYKSSPFSESKRFISLYLLLNASSLKVYLSSSRSSTYSSLINYSYRNFTSESGQEVSLFIFPSQSSYKSSVSCNWSKINQLLSSKYPSSVSKSSMLSMSANQPDLAPWSLIKFHTFSRLPILPHLTYIVNLSSSPIIDLYSLKDKWIAQESKFLINFCDTSYS